MMFPMSASAHPIHPAIDDALRAGDAVRLAVAVERDAARLREAGGRATLAPDSRRGPARDERGPLPAAAGLVPEDLEVIGLRLRDASWSVIAEALGTTVAGAHRRYDRAIAALAAAVEARQAVQTRGEGPARRPRRRIRLPRAAEVTRWA